MSIHGRGRGVASRVSRHVRDLIWKNLIDSHPLPRELTKKTIWLYGRKRKSPPPIHITCVVLAWLGNKVYSIHLARATMGSVILCRAKENRKSILADDWIRQKTLYSHKHYESFYRYIFLVQCCYMYYLLIFYDYIGFFPKYLNEGFTLDRHLYKNNKINNIVLLQ